MKKFLSIVAELKTWGCLSFTASLVTYTLCSMLWGEKAVSHSRIYQLLAMCGLITVLQYVCFSGEFLKKLRYSLRMVLFGAAILLLCGGFAWVFQWLPLKSMGAWGLFFLIFLVIFVVLGLGFEIYFQAAGKKYDGLLGQYKAQKEKRGNQ